MVNPMPCPICGKILEWEEGEDEFNGDVLIPYAGWWCSVDYFRFDEISINPAWWIRGRES